MVQIPEEDDVVLSALVREATDDVETVGLILTGSRGAGSGTRESDYDLSWVLTDAACERAVHTGQPLHIRRQIGEGEADISYTRIADLHALAQKPDWRMWGYAHARLLLDKNGAVATALAAIAFMPEERARAEAAGWFDAYLNAFYRSLKAWRRGDELGARLQCADSIGYLVRTLFFLERRWPPYHDRFQRELSTLDLQGWPPGFLSDTFLRLLRTGDPSLQQALEARVATLLRSRGFGDVLDNWGSEIESVSAFRF